MGTQYYFAGGFTTDWQPETNTNLKQLLTIAFPTTWILSVFGKRKYTSVCSQQEDFFNELLKSLKVTSAPTHPIIACVITTGIKFHWHSVVSYRYTAATLFLCGCSLRLAILLLPTVLQRGMRTTVSSLSPKWGTMWECEETPRKRLNGQLQQQLGQKEN